MSVVRFRPGPPRIRQHIKNANPHRLAFFLLNGKFARPVYFRHLPQLGCGTANDSDFCCDLRLLGRFAEYLENSMLNKYRSDIDGLRAIAVLPVIFFHLHLVGFSGGYVGVDIFFVISGYLITGLIYNEMKKNTFSLKTFYIRRIRRIAPALLILLFTVTVFSFLILKPEELRSFGLSLATQPISGQNIIFFAEGEYFLGSDRKPLLHTWSLAVEEQFYLFWPLLLLGLRKFPFKMQIFIIVTIMTFSFMISLGLMNISPKASFFMLPPRAWELGAGGLIAIFETKTSFRKLLTHHVRTVLGLLGFALIFFSIFSLTSETPFPGFAVLLPVTGTIFLLASGIGSLTFIGKVLSFKPIVLIGLISYPLYLWHWPIISLLHQFKLDLSTPLNIFFIFTVTIFLSVLTYRYIETPIRKKKWIPTTRQLLTVSGIGFLFLTSVGIHLWISGGASYRYPSAARNLLTAPLAARTERCGFIFKVLNPRNQVCTLVEASNATKKILLWGNSHADHWSGLFTDLAQENNSAFYLNARNCRATPDSDFCGNNVQKSILDFITKEKISDVVLSSTGYGSYNLPDEIFEKNLKNIVHKLAEKNVRTWLVIDIPAGDALNPIVAYEKDPNDPKLGSIPLDEFKKVKEREKKLFDSLSGEFTGVRVIDPSINFCNSENCLGGENDVVWYRDSGHISNAGAKNAKEQFMPIFKP